MTGDTLDALQNMMTPGNSADDAIERFTWWDHRGTSEWVQYDFPRPKLISSTDVYWFDDKPTGGSCRPPARWHLEYKDGDVWRPVDQPSDYAVSDNKFNRVTFTPVTTSAARIVVQLQPNESGGILSWRVGQ